MKEKLQSNTCLAVVREKGTKKKIGELVVAADRRVSWGHQYQTMLRPKVTKRNGFILAGCGDGYLCDIVTQLLIIPEVPKSMRIFNFMHQVFRKVLEEELKENGFEDDHGNVALPDKTRAVILIAVRKELYEMDINNKTGISINQIDAPYGHGCGGDFALGSLKTTENSKLSSNERLIVALNIASEISAGCDNNIDIIRESDEDTV